MQLSVTDCFRVGWMLSAVENRACQSAAGIWTPTVVRSSPVTCKLMERYTHGLLQHHPELGSQPSREVCATVWRPDSNKAGNLGDLSLPLRKTTKEPTGATQTVMAT